MNDLSIDEKRNIYNRNTLLLFMLQEMIDKRIREKICCKCSQQHKDKRGCTDHNGRKFCKLLVNKRKKIKKLSYAWQFNLLNYSPSIHQSELLRKIADSTRIAQRSYISCLQQISCNLDCDIYAVYPAMMVCFRLWNAVL